MPHEHINSSIGTIDEHGAERITRERVVLTWNKPSTSTAYDTPTDGYVQIMSEWPDSKARFPSPELIEIDTTAPHAFHVADDSNECRWCGQTESVGPHGITNPDLPHRYRGSADGPSRGNTSCIHCNRVAGHVIHTDAAPEPLTSVDPRTPYALGGEAWASPLPDPRPAPRGPGTGNPAVPHFYGPTAGPDPDPDMDPCDFCGLGKHDGDAAHLVQRQPRTVLTEGAPTWSEPCTGLTVTFTRSDINRLIKMLRRARDEAYGADA